MDKFLKDKVLYGGFTPRDENSELAFASFGYILNDIQDIKSSYIRLGFHLCECKRMGYYFDFGYASFYDFVYYNFGLDKSALSRIINVYMKFCAVDKSSGYSSKKMWIDEKYADYSYSQLCEMLPLDSNSLKDITPDMSIKEIRDYKKALKNKKIGIVDIVPVATSQLENFLDVKKFGSLFGAARSAYVKKADAQESIVLEVFDCNGKPVPNINNVWADLLGIGSLGSERGKAVVVRLTYSLDGNE